MTLAPRANRTGVKAVSLSSSRRRVMAITRAGASKVLGWPKCSYKRLKLTQLLGQLGVFLTWVESGELVVLRRVAAHLVEAAVRAIRLT